jgi:hypothetical protein
MSKKGRQPHFRSPKAVCDVGSKLGFDERCDDPLAPGEPQLKSSYFYPSHGGLRTALRWYCS